MRTRSLVLATLALAGTGAATATASAGLTAARTCHGMPVTIAASKGTVTGTPRADVIALTGRATVNALGGSDVICGSSAADTINAGPGNDVVLARRGADAVNGGTGRDQLYGEAGNDHLMGGLGGDVLMGGSGRDTVVVNSHAHAHESQIGDTVMPGTKAISLVVPPNSLQNLIDNGQQVAMSWAPLPDTLPVAWASFSPMVTNSVWLSGGLLAYATPNLELMPGMALTPQAQVAVTQATGTAFLSPSFTMTAGPTQGQNPSILNGGVGPAAAGLAKQVAINGAGAGSPPINAGALYGESILTLPMPTTLTLFMPMGPAPQPGSVLYPSAVIEGQHISVNTAVPTEVQGISYNLNNGFRADS